VIASLLIPPIPVWRTPRSGRSAIACAGFGRWSALLDGARLSSCYPRPMRYVVLLRYGLREFHVALTVGRSHDGDISCTEPLRQEHRAGMTWSPNGLYCLTTDRGGQLNTQRTPLASLKEPEVAYSIPGLKLVDGGLPPYAYDVDHGATVQISGHAVVEEPHRVALQLVLVPRGQEPYHRETVGDRRIDDGEPTMWIVLTRSGGEPAERLVANRVLRWPPPVRVGNTARPQPIDATALDQAASAAPARHAALVSFSPLLCICSAPEAMQLPRLREKGLRLLQRRECSSRNRNPTTRHHEVQALRICLDPIYR